MASGVDARQAEAHAREALEQAIALSEEKGNIVSAQLCRERLERL
jgi:hypothetical protein